MTYITADNLRMSPGINHLFTTRIGGFSEGIYSSLNFRSIEPSKANLKKNFEVTAELLGCTYDDIVYTKQIHGDRVEVVIGGSGFRYMVEEYDGIITNLPNVALFAFSADCQIILFFDPVNKAIGVAHSGWRGTVLDISGNLINKMTQNYGTDPKDLICAIGPSICKECFECDSDVPEAFSAKYGKEILLFCEKRGAKYRFDLNGATKYILKKHGIPDENIEIIGLCTCCFDSELFWSHRRQGDERGVHAGGIVLWH